MDQSEEGIDIEPSLALIHDYGSCGDMADDDDTFEEVDNFLVELGHDIDENIGKYFPSIVMTSKQKQKLFRHKQNIKL